MKVVRGECVTGTTMIKVLIFMVMAVSCLSFLGTFAFAQALPQPMNNKIQAAAVGLQIFNDKNLSEPQGRQSCASCHQGATAGVTGFSDSPNAVSTGGITGASKGGRNAPTNAYVAGFCPPFDAAKGEPVGGFFWDGRSMTKIDQATKPFFNPVELANPLVDFDPVTGLAISSPNLTAFINKIRAAAYATNFKAAFGNKILDVGNEPAALNAVATAIVAMEQTQTFNAFTSKFDAVQLGLATFTPQEELGFAVFQEYCSKCHSTNATTPEGTRPLFTTFIYRNVGVPTNTAEPAANVGDIGLAGNPLLDPLLVDASRGKFKVPTLRNIAKSAPYMHNGVFTTLADVAKFYNRRDILDIVPDVAANVTSEVVSSAGDTVGNLNLPFVGDGNGTTADGDEEAALVAFMETLTDGYPVKFPK